MDDVALKALRFIRSGGLLDQDREVLVGFSGGPDSLALVLILEQLSRGGLLPIGVRLAHLNHCLRGARSDGDEAFCRRFADEHRLSVETARLDVKALARRGESLEQSARRVRREFLVRTASRAGLRTILLAHHADDVAETVLMRLLRGCGLRGLGAMHAARPVGPRGAGIRIVRPLLELRRSALLAMLDRHGQPYRLDESNLDTRFLRNRVRHEMIPALQRRAPGRLVELLCSLNREAGALAALLDGVLDRAWPRLCVEARGGLVALDAGALADMPPALRKAALRRAVEFLRPRSDEPPGLTRTHYEDAAALPLLPVGAAVSLPGGLAARREHGVVCLCESGHELTAPQPPRELPAPGRLRLPEAGMELTAELINRPPGDGAVPIRPAGPREAFLSLPALELPLTVRYRRPGDRLRPLGAPGARKLKKLLIDRKVPFHLRDRTPLVVAADGRIAWVVGIEIAEPFKLTGAEERILHLRADDLSRQD